MIYLFPIMLVGNKYDLGNLRAIQTKDARSNVERRKAYFSFKHMLLNVENSFLTVLREVYEVESKKALTTSHEDGAGHRSILSGRRMTVIPNDDNLKANRA